MGLIFANLGYPIKADGLFNNVNDYFKDKELNYEKKLFFSFYGNYLKSNPKRKSESEKYLS